LHGRNSRHRPGGKATEPGERGEIMIFSVISAPPLLCGLSAGW
jgi:hypothetical protein